jgi:hypothetical protein
LAAGVSGLLVGAALGSVIDTGGVSLGIAGTLAASTASGAAFGAGIGSAVGGDLFTNGQDVNWSGYLEGGGKGAAVGAVAGLTGGGAGLAVSRGATALLGQGLTGTSASVLSGGFAGGFVGDQAAQGFSIGLGWQNANEYSLSRSLIAGGIGAALSAGAAGVKAWRQSAAAAKLVNCFPPDTLVGTESGLRPMSQVGAGDRVWGYDFLNGVWRLCRVECRHDANYDGPLVTLYADVGMVTATAFHPFWVIQGDDLASRPTPRHVGPDEDQGGSLAGRWVNSHDLREGDVILLRDRGPVTVRRVIQRHERTPVCNLTVEELHTFAVGEMQALVHNTSGTGASASPTLPEFDGITRGYLVPTEPPGPPVPMQSGPRTGARFPVTVHGIPTRLSSIGRFG